MAQGVTDSQFYMWRTLFAVAHADDVVTNEEVRFMAEALEDVPFSEGQRKILNADVKEAQDIESMFAGITDVLDQAEFFKYAHELVHVDGEYGRKEQEVMLRLQELHVKWANVDELVGRVQLQFEGDFTTPPPQVTHTPKKFKDTIYSFRDGFLKRRFKD